MTEKVIEKSAHTGNIYLGRDEEPEQKKKSPYQKAILTVLCMLAIIASGFLILVFSQDPVHPMDPPIVSTGGDK